MAQSPINRDFEYALRKMLVLMMLRDDKVKLEEIYGIKAIVRQLTGKEASDIEVQEIVDALAQDNESLEDYLTDIANKVDINEKTMLVRAAVLLSSSDGDLHDDEMTLLHQFADSFGFSNSELKAIIEKTVNAD